MGGFSTIHKGSYKGLKVAVKKTFNPNAKFNWKMAETKDRENSFVIIINKWGSNNNIKRKFFATEI